ncbi:MAG: D-glycerate dehydrogenase [Melioribacteraceae bacterium]|nr:D-glycerate dehydrogenase [Melioribacteraceae bacterium]MCF8355375.1 D-glycerate dehydrogenase [Melioribacteraceae bacterium]MCF8394620.1 D-glycerate dehydrogenase [Melioribacteraceae bacterium]MCF8419617.1 D-glycerate dehydrogenase [Melioribacteraceae bacterium]
MKVFITRKISNDAVNLLRKEGFTVDVFKSNRPITKVELIQKAKNSEGVISLLTDVIDRDIIDGLKKCKVIANYAVGYNNIDVEYAKSKGIVVTNTPDILTHATADLAVALVLACARNIRAGEKIMRDNEFKGWEPQLLLGVELRGKTVGIIGSGRIGQETALRLKSFGTKIIYFNRSKKAEFEKSTGAKKVSLNALLKSSDIISLHVPLTDATYHLLNRTNMKLLKSNCIIVNTARGEIIEEKELIKLLKKNKIFSAGFDVYENEPDVNKELLKLKNVVLLPHLGSATNEARSEMALLAAKNIITVLKGKKAITPV